MNVAKHTAVESNANVACGNAPQPNNRNWHPVDLAAWARMQEEAELEMINAFRHCRARRRFISEERRS